MAIFDIRQRTAYLFMAVMVGHIILISAQVNTSRGIPLLESATFGVFAELQRVASGVIGLARDGWEGYVALRSVRLENERLEQQIAALRIVLQQEQALATQSRALQSLLDFSTSISVETVAATVIAGGASPDFRTMTISKGTRSGLRANQAVLAPEGVVGRVITPGAFAAKVQLLIDRNAAVAALDERSRAQGIVVGTGTGRLRMEYVPGTMDVRVGDRVVTSGLDGIYPKGFVVGQIESVERSAATFSSIVIRPTVNFATLESVLVVVSQPVTGGEPAGDP